MEASNILFQLATQLGEKLKQQGLKFATAESCTGGGVAAAITDIAGSSDWFDCGFIVYSNQAKQAMLDVDAKTLEEQGAVSEAVAIQMVQGALARSQADVAVSITGIAGPDGGTVDKPVGTVWFAWGNVDGDMKTRCAYFAGDRAQVRFSAAKFALDQVKNFIS